MRSNRGVAYIDVLLALFVLALGAAAILGMLDVGSQASRSNEYYIIATQIARAQIEAVRSTKGSMLSDQTNGPLIEQPQGLADLPQGAATLTIADSATLAGAKDVTVTVTWQHPITGAADSLSLKTMVSPDGPTS